MSKRRVKQLKAWVLVLIDCVAIGAALCVFAYFDHVKPKPIAAPVYVRTTSAPTPARIVENVPADTAEAETIDPEPQAEMEPVLTAIDGAFDFEGAFSDGKVLAARRSYKSENISITIEHLSASSPRKQNYYVADIYIKSIDCLQTAFANDTYGKSIYEDFLKLSRRNKAILSVNTDMYSWGSRNGGLVIRNGVLYRDKLSANEDMLVIYRDGSMQPIYAGTEVDATALIDAGAWQGFSFGPSLLNEDGSVREDLGGYDEDGRQPRTVIGMVEPGHYVFIAVDGRSDDAAGFTYEQCAMTAVKYGCKVAFNMDGGRSSQMGFNNEIVNNPERGGRTVCDILYICEPKE